MKKRLFLDMDGTLAQFHDADKMFIEAMWTPGFYAGLKPFENAIEGVKLFIKEHPEVDVYILSAVLDTDPPFIVGEKNEWLDKYLPEVPVERRIFTHAGDNKADYIGCISKNDYLLDDFNKNLFEFQDAGAHAIKFHNNVNMRGLGAYGGEAGPLWNGDILHYDANLEVLAAKLANLVCGEPMPERNLAQTVDAMVKNIRGLGQTKGSGYYELKQFDVDGEAFALVAEAFKHDEGTYGVCWFVEFCDGDSLFADYLYTKSLSVKQLKTVVSELVDTDFTADVKKSLAAQKDSLLDKMAAAEHMKQSKNNRDIQKNNSMNR